MEAATMKQWDVGAAGAVIERGRVLFVRRTYGEGCGRWSIPGGYADHGERLDETAVREVREETGVVAEVVDVVGVRTRYTHQGGAVYVIFRMQPVWGNPVPDGVEVDRATYLTGEEIAAMDDREIQALSRHAALAALRKGPGLIEEDCPPRSGEAYRVFLLR
jgi:ADP-ribose pyrophosphatase YjhB (NUDIX family)